MKSENSLTSACRYCQYFQTEGRRGGTCQQLGVLVKGSWKACCLATPLFTTSWQNLEEMLTLTAETSCYPVTATCCIPKSAEESPAYATEPIKGEAIAV